MFGNINNQRTQQELLTHANECAQRLARDTRDWSALIKTATVTGDGVAESFALPYDFLRLLLDSNVWTSRSSFIPLVYVNSYDEWLRRKASGFWDSRGAYILIGRPHLHQSDPGGGRHRDVCLPVQSDHQRRRDRPDRHAIHCRRRHLQAR